jgi:hypothetical protein
MVVFVYGGAGSGAGSGDGITDRVSPVASLLRQAVAQSKKLPEVAGELYANSRMRNDPPTEREMVGVLCTVMAEFKKSYVLVDALDEFSRKSRNQLLEVLRRLRSQSKISLNILFTSRAIPLHHIFEAWQPPDIIKLTISMPESELEILVKDLLPRKFRDWRPDFLTEIVKKVVMVSAGR